VSMARNGSSIGPSDRRLFFGDRFHHRIFDLGLGNRLRQRALLREDTVQRSTMGHGEETVLSSIC